MGKRAGREGNDNDIRDGEQRKGRERGGCVEGGVEGAERDKPK